MLTALKWSIVSVILGFLAACDESKTSLNNNPQQNNQELGREPTSWQSLVNSDEWTLLELAQDPYYEALDSRTACAELDYGPEYDGIEISTQFCDYISLTQATLFEINSGDIIKLNLWHSPLLSNVPSEGLIALQIADQIIWSQPLVIPSPALSWTLELVSPRSFEAGIPMIFHVHNHGSNTYTLNEISIARYN